MVINYKKVGVIIVIEKVMNNSLIHSKDENNKDIIITGKGVGFCKKSWRCS